MEYSIENVSHDILELIKHTFKFNLLDIEEDKQYNIKWSYDETNSALGDLTIQMEDGSIVTTEINMWIEPTNGYTTIVMDSVVPSEMNLKWREEEVILHIYLLSNQIDHYSVHKRPHK